MTKKLILGFIIMALIFSSITTIVITKIKKETSYEIARLEEQLVIEQQKTADIQKQYDDMEYYYMRDFAFDLVTGMTYKVGTIRTKRDDIFAFKYLVEIGEEKERVYVYSKQDFPYDFDVILVYDKYDKLFAIVAR